MQSALVGQGVDDALGYAAGIAVGREVDRRVCGEAVDRDALAGRLALERLPELLVHLQRQLDRLADGLLAEVDRVGPLEPVRVRVTKVVADREEQPRGIVAAAIGTFGKGGQGEFARFEGHASHHRNRTRPRTLPLSGRRLDSQSERINRLSSVESRPLATPIVRDWREWIEFPTVGA